ncbi:MAG: TetR family transcriptional regulator [Verrucomicrobiota bacterium JB022]|nr:TetR family transcriptional regulator [Verrucomicrobiota bacterium JB022]
MSSDTKENILQAAESLFAERGFNGTSVRDITDRAGANVAAVNYHFGSKHDLFVELMRRHVEPINRLRLSYLEERRERSGGLPLTVQQIFEAFFEPMGETLVDENGRPKLTAIRLAFRAFHETPELLQALKSECFREVCDTFGAELAKTVPHLSFDDLLIRFNFALSTMVGTLLHLPDMPCFCAGKTDAAAFRSIIRQMTLFVAAGFVYDQAEVTQR